MAEVLSPPMQSSTTITMLHTRPSSADAFQAPQQQYSQPSRYGQASRGMYNHGQNNSYRGSSSPVQPYAFQSTPNLRQESRTNSAPSTSHGPIANHKATPSASTTSSDTSSQPSTKEEPLLNTRPTSLFSSQLPDLSFTSFEQPVKASPDRYRRPAQKRADSSASNVTPKASPITGGSVGGPADGVSTQPQPLQRQPSADDMAAPKTGHPELAKRYRRRSLNPAEAQNIVLPPSAQAGPGATQRPSSGHGPTSTPTSIRPIDPFSQITVNGDGEAQAVAGAGAPTSTKAESIKEVDRQSTVGARGVDQKLNVSSRSASEGTKRLATPSPLSRQAGDQDSISASPASSPNKPKTYAAAAQSAIASPSPAAQQLAAVSDKDLNKGMKSRLRRAFSFGSAQELRRAAGENNHAAVQNAQQTKEQHQQQIDSELDAEQLEVARRQEAAGIGAGIYSGQGGFSGSTDNLSISSTASSASMMLRKMGQGAKKSARSIKGLFRPKSVIGVPAADGPIQVGTSTAVEPTVSQISMITVEAERQNVNVNARPVESTGGGTAFPKLERNSVDAVRTGPTPEAPGSVDGSDSHSRRSVVGSDKDRAEVLAAVKKGILKRSATGSPSGSPIVRPNEAGLTSVPHFTDSPTSSLPGTPKEQAQGRSSSAPNVNSDYFSARMTMAKSMPGTPNGSARNISFSPRIQFHDAWSSSEYDRRGDIATCNRLTPMLAQQIKEELNTFKMEMEVHELSKPHTHFF